MFAVYRYRLFVCSAKSSQQLTSQCPLAAALVDGSTNNLVSPIRLESFPNSTYCTTENC